jgi:ABC-type dipeptide/oligopeptide/nickel transport system ATPase subunit
MMKWLGVFMLEVNGISYHYKKETWVFKNLTLSINPGEIVGLYGNSGSGKTTMAKIIAGYIKPYDGNVLVDGQSILGTGINPVQLVWQHPEKVINPKWRLEKVLDEVEGLDEEILPILGIKNEWLQRWPSELSGGELQRFCLVLALGKNTKYLIADEMTTMLDAITQAQIWHAVLHLAKKRNIGVLAISHNQHLFQKISHRMINFNDLAERE